MPRQVSNRGADTGHPHSSESRENLCEFRVSGEHEIESHGWIVAMLLIEVTSNVGSSGIGTVVPTARRRVRAS